jgi:hypothetical protein
MKKRVRRSTWVDPKYQLAQAAVGVAGNLLVAVLMAALMSWFYLLVFRAPLGVSHNRLVPLLVAGAILFVMVASAYVSFRRSRALAGMVRKIGMVMSAAAEGRFPDRPLVFRRDDYAAGLTEPLNRCLVEMRRRRQDAERAAARLQELADAVRGEAIVGPAVATLLEEQIGELRCREDRDEA